MQAAVAVEGAYGVWLALPVSDLGASILTAVWLTREIRGLGRKHRDLTEQMVPLDGISI